MAKHRFEIVETDDETETVRLDGKDLFSTNHDEHGWMGMRLVRDLVEKIAAEIGATVTKA